MVNNMQEEFRKLATGFFISQTSNEMQIITNQSAMVVYIPKYLPEIWKYKTKFLSTILKPSETYLNKSQFQFRIKKD